jgi:hypothetical protein
MPVDSVELYIQAADVAGEESRFREALRRLPGVKSVGELSQDDESIEARVRVEFDARETNPLLMKDALEREGFTIMSAGEEP